MSKNRFSLFCRKDLNFKWLIFIDLYRKLAFSGYCLSKKSCEHFYKNGHDLLDIHEHWRLAQQFLAHFQRNNFFGGVKKTKEAIPSSSNQNTEQRKVDNSWFNIISVLPSNRKFNFLLFFSFNFFFSLSIFLYLFFA